MKQKNAPSHGSYSPVSVPVPVLYVGEPVGAAADDVESEALADVRGMEVSETDDAADERMDVLAAIDVGLEAKLDDTDAPDVNADEGTPLLALTTADDAMDVSGDDDGSTLTLAAELETEATDVNGRETGRVEVSSLETALGLLAGTLDGAAWTTVASWTRPSATRRPVESFMANDAGVKRGFSALSYSSYTNGKTSSCPARAQKQMGNRSHQKNQYGDHPREHCHHPPRSGPPEPGAAMHGSKSLALQYSASRIKGEGRRDHKSSEALSFVCAQTQPENYRWTGNKVRLICE